MRTHDHDVIVIGGRLAGAATAMLLARAGRRVLVLDRGRYGSDTLSTHAFMRAGVLQLSRWGLLDEIRDAGTPAVRRTVIRYGDVDEVVAIKPIPGCEALYAPRRHLLDRVLVDAAFRAGADIRFGANVTDVLRDGSGRVVGVTGRDRNGRFEARAPLTIGADGVRSRTAELVGAPVTRRGRNATAMVANWWSGIDADGYQWLYGDDDRAAPRGLSAGIIPTNDGRACVWAGVPWTRFDELRTDPERGLRRVFERIAPDWAAQLHPDRTEGPFRGFPGVPGLVRRAGGPGWALVGDAGYFKDPLTAHGMTDALRDAELLARAVLAADGPAELDAGLRGFEEQRDALSSELLELADRVAAYDWTMEELRELLVGMSLAMRPEVAHVSALDPLPAVA